MIVVYPSDPSTKFLQEIITNTDQFISKKIDDVLPTDYIKTFSKINLIEESTTFLFLGHGFSGGLYGGCDNPEYRTIFISTAKGINVFRNKKIILLACRSSEYINSLEGVYLSAIGFGNIVTSQQDLKTKNDIFYYRDSIGIFRSDLLDLFSKSLIEAFKMEYTFLQFYNGLKLRMNKYICQHSLSKNINEKKAGELMFSLKKEMIIGGDINAKLTSN
jgi:hypothetical protein